VVRLRIHRCFGREDLKGDGSLVNRTANKDNIPAKRVPKAKLRTVTVVNPHYVGDKKLNDAFEQALAISIQKPEIKIKKTVR